MKNFNHHVAIWKKNLKNAKSEQLYKKKMHRQKNKNKDKQNEEKKFTVGNSMISRIDLAKNMRIHEFKSLKPRKNINLESPKRNTPKNKRISNNKNNMKFTFKVDTVNENSNIKEKSDSPFSKKKKASIFDKRKSKRMSDQKKSIIFSSEISNNIKPVKNARTAKKGCFDVEKKINKRSNITEKKTIQKEKVTKGSLVVPKIGQNLNLEDEKIGIKNSMAYFAKEKKEDCKIQ